MEKNNKDKRKIKNLIKLLIYIIIITFSFILSVIALNYNWTIAFQILFGIFSGSIISLLSFLSIKQTENEEDHDDVLDLIAQLKAKTKGDDIKIYGSLDDKSLNFAEMLKNAQKRIWVLGVDLSDFIMRYKDCLVDSKNSECDIRILAMHPNNIYVESRYHEEKFKSRQEMVNSLISATDDIRELKIEHPDLSMQIKLYLSQPTVVLYLIDDQLIISHILCSDTKNKVVNSVRLSCNLASFTFINDDFVDINGHFSKIWEEAIAIEDYDSCQNYIPQNLGLNNEILSFNIKERRKVSSSKTFFKGVAKHVSNLLFPIISFGVAVIVLILVLSGVINNEMMQELFFNSIVGTILGFISSAALTFIIYFYDYLNEKKEKNENLNITDKRKRFIIEELNNMPPRFSMPSGISAYRARKDIDIKNLIINAKKRVWIYATNHRVIGDRVNNVEIVDFLNANAGEIDVRFLMLDPESIFIATRFHEIPSKTTPESFSNEITGRLSALDEEYGKNKKIKTRLFVVPPTFMMYIIDDLLIVSYILRQGRASDQTAFIFDMNNPKVRVYANKYIDHFNTIWESSGKLRKQHIKKLSTKKKQNKHPRYKIFNANGISFASIKNK